MYSVLSVTAARDSMSLAAQACPTSCYSWDCSPLGSSVRRFPRQEYWCGLPFPTPGDLPDPGIGPHLPSLLHCHFLQTSCLPALWYGTLGSTFRVWVLTAAFPDWVALASPLNHSVPQFPHLDQ